MYALLPVKVHVLALNIVIDIIFIDLRLGKSCVFRQATLVRSRSNRDRTNVA